VPILVKGQIKLFKALKYRYRNVKQQGKRPRNIKVFD
jgi:hypothetical protein